MPKWPKHLKHARSLGIQIDPQTARDIDRFLDFPTVGGHKIAHKALHLKDLAPKLAELVWGPNGKAYVEAHLDLDQASLRKKWKPQIFKLKIPAETKVAEADVKITLQKSLEELFQVIDEFSNLANWKQETKVQKKPKSGLRSLFHILLVLAALSGLAD